MLAQTIQHGALGSTTVRRFAFTRSQLETLGSSPLQQILRAYTTTTPARNLPSLPPNTTALPTTNNSPTPCPTTRAFSPDSQRESRLLSPTHHTNKRHIEVGGKLKHGGHEEHQSDGRTKSVTLRHITGETGLAKILACPRCKAAHRQERPWRRN